MTIYSDETLGYSSGSYRLFNTLLSGGRIAAMGRKIHKKKD
jgi:hypothetical protein